MDYFIELLSNVCMYAVKEEVEVPPLNFENLQRKRSIYSLYTYEFVHIEPDSGIGSIIYAYICTRVSVYTYLCSVHLCNCSAKFLSSFNNTYWIIHYAIRFHFFDKWIWLVMGDREKWNQIFRNLLFSLGRKQMLANICELQIHTYLSSCSCSTEYLQKYVCI